jgi:hypothetical protein
MSSETLHEVADVIGPAVIDRHRAIVSLMEELEAVDWYDQRAAATQDPPWPPSSPTTGTRRRSTLRWCSNGCAATTP